MKIGLKTHKRQQWTAPPPKIGDKVFFKNKQLGKWNLKWRAGYNIVCIDCNGHYLHVENLATGKARPYNVKDIVHEPPVELCNVDTMFGRAGKFINHPANLPTIPLNTNWNNINYIKKRKLFIKTTLFQYTLHRYLSRKETGYTTSWICDIPSSSKGLSYMLLRDNHSPWITRWLK